MNAAFLSLLAVTMPLAAAPVPEDPSYQIVFTLRMLGEKTEIVKITTQLDEDFSLPPKNFVVIRYTDPQAQPDENVPIGTFVKGSLRLGEKDGYTLKYDFEKTEVAKWQLFKLPNDTDWPMPVFSTFNVKSEIPILPDVPYRIRGQSDSELTIQLTRAEASAPAQATAASASATPPDYNILFTLSEPGRRPLTVTASAKMDEDFATPPKRVFLIIYPDSTMIPDKELKTGAFVNGRLLPAPNGQFVVKFDFDKTDIKEWIKYKQSNGHEVSLPVPQTTAFGSTVTLETEQPIFMGDGQGRKLEVRLVPQTGSQTVQTSKTPRPASSSRPTTR